MKIPAILLTAGSLFYVACNNTPKPSAVDHRADSLRMKQDAENLNETIKKMDVPSQLFSAPGNQLSLIRGKKGTVIFLTPGDLETEDGQAPGNNVIVELKEITNQADLTRANAQTISNGNLLVSGGAYYVNMTSGGRQLKLKKDKALKIAFPKITDSAMGLYYGQRESDGLINWQPTKELLTSKNGYSIDTKDTVGNKSIMVYNSDNYKLMGYFGDTGNFKRDTASLGVMKKKADVIRKETLIKQRIQQYIQDSISFEKEKKYIIASKKLNESLYDITNIKKLGWINCDKLFPDVVRTNITYTINPKDSIAIAYVYLVYKDINTFINNMFNNRMESGTRYFENIPIGYQARLIAVANRNNELLTCKMDLTIVKDQHTLILWKKTTPEELNSYFDVKSNWGSLTK